MEDFDVVIIGSGSGNSILTPDFDDAKVAIVEKGVFGGTCLNRGCIPSKMFVYAADLVMHARHSAELGVDLHVEGVRWSDIVDRVFGRIDPIAQGGEDYRLGLDNVTVVKAEATFTGPRTLDVGGTAIRGDQVVIAAGARPVIPDIPGLAESRHHTSDTIMRLPQVPARLGILGGGYIAAEMAHVFEAFGSRVTMINRRDIVLREEDEAINRSFTALAERRYDLRLHTTIERVEESGHSLELVLDTAGGRDIAEVDELLVATGRTPNSDRLGLEAAGVEVDDDGYIVSDDYLRTTAEGVWVLGDITNPDQLKHTANAEARIVAHNLAHPDRLRPVDLWPTPHAVFSHPQVAGVGPTEQALRAEGVDYVAATRTYSDTAYGWAMEDTTGLCKVIADPGTRQLLAAHVMGPQASTLIQQLIQGMKFGQTVDQMAAGQLYIHPALSEVVEQALLAL